MSLEVDLCVRLDDFELDAAFDVRPNEVVALLGPNGAGETTTLRAIAGLLPLERGHVELAGRTLEDTATGVRLAPESRGIGIVFQDYLLFPHLNARDNVAFGRRAQGTPRLTAQREAEDWLERLGIRNSARMRPHQLSGGQAQRVALARALVCRPSLLMLDEPLGALDAATRHLVRHDLRAHLDAFHGPTLMITHDPVEAITLATRLVVLENGRVTHTGDIGEVTRRPTSEWVARFVGLNLYRGNARNGSVRIGDVTLSAPSPLSGEVFVLIRPQAVALHRSAPGGSPRNTWQCVVAAIEPFADRVRVSTRGPLQIVAEITPAAVADLGLAVGSQAWVAVKATEIELYL